MTNPLHRITKKQPETPTTPDIQQTNPTTPPDPTNWRTQANCLGKNHLMFPKTHKDITYISQARHICRTCTVQQPCLQYALQYPATDMHGIWAGLTSRQLAAEQRRQGIKPTKPTLAAMRHHNG